MIYCVVAWISFQISIRESKEESNMDRKDLSNIQIHGLQRVYHHEELSESLSDSQSRIEEEIELFQQ
jgi:hypothetical protein